MRSITHGTYAKGAGKKMGDNLASGAKSAMQGLTRSIGDVGKRGAKQLTDNLRDGVSKGARDVGATFNRTMDQAFQRSSADLGKKLKGALDNAGTTQALRDMSTQAGTAIDTINGVQQAMKGLKDRDALTALHGVSDALTKIGQSDAGGAIDRFANTVAQKKGEFDTLNGVFKDMVATLGLIAPAAASCCGPAGRCCRGGWCAGVDRREGHR